MKQSDWQNAFGPAPESFRECVDQTLNRLEDKEMRKRTKFTTALVAAALITALLASAAIAAPTPAAWPIAPQLGLVRVEACASKLALMLRPAAIRFGMAALTRQRYGIV